MRLKNGSLEIFPGFRRIHLRDFSQLISSDHTLLRTIFRLHRVTPQVHTSEEVVRTNRQKVTDKHKTAVKQSLVKAICNDFSREPFDNHNFARFCSKIHELELKHYPKSSSVVISMRG